MTEGRVGEYITQSRSKKMLEGSANFHKSIELQFLIHSTNLETFTSFSFISIIVVIISWVVTPSSKRETSGFGVTIFIFKTVN